MIKNFLLKAAGADPLLAGQSTLHAQWQLSISGLSLLLAVPLNVAGFYCAMLAATGWRYDLWPGLVTVSATIALVIYIMDARGVVAATYLLGWRLAHDRELFGCAPTSSPESSTMAIRVRAAFSIVMSLVSAGGLALAILHSDIESARRRQAAASNQTAIASATELVKAHLDEAKSRINTANEELAALNDPITNSAIPKHPIIDQLTALRKMDATLSAALVQQREVAQRAKFLMECEERGGQLPGCTGQPGQSEAYHRAEKIFNGAEAELGILGQQYETVHSEFLQTQATLDRLRDATQRKLSTARDDLVHWEQQSYGEPFQKLLLEQPSYSAPGESLISQVEAFFGLEEAHPAAALLVLVLLKGCLIAIDLLNLIGARAWATPHDYAAALVLQTEHAMHQLGEQFQFKHQPLLQARDGREQEALTLRKRHREWSFQNANGDAALQAALRTLSNHLDHSTTH